MLDAKGLAWLEAMAQPLSEVGLQELWRGELTIELRQLQAVQAEIEVAEEKLDAIAAADPRVRLLRTIPGVGPRLSEAIECELQNRGQACDFCDSSRQGGSTH